MKIGTQVIRKQEFRTGIFEKNFGPFEVADVTHKADGTPLNIFFR